MFQANLTFVSFNHLCLGCLSECTSDHLFEMKNALFSKLFKINHCSLYIFCLVLDKESNESIVFLIGPKKNFFCFFKGGQGGGFRPKKYFFLQFYLISPYIMIKDQWKKSNIISTQVIAVYYKFSIDEIICFLWTSRTLNYSI